MDEHEEIETIEIEGHGVNAVVVMIFLLLMTLMVAVTAIVITWLVVTH
jgi:hypothetical protein